jgi:hypothetical protein
LEQWLVYITKIQRIGHQQFNTCLFVLITAFARQKNLQCCSTQESDEDRKLHTGIQLKSSCHCVCSNTEISPFKFISNPLQFEDISRVILLSNVVFIWLTSISSNILIFASHYILVSQLFESNYQTIII